MKHIKLAFFLAFSFLLIGSATAATRTVTKWADTNDNICNEDCSLREAVAAAAAGDTIAFQPALTGQITLVHGVVEIDKNLVINGNDNLKVSGDFSSRVFYISSGAKVTINNLILKDGVAQNPDVLPGAAGDGGAVLVTGSSSFVLNDSKVYSNHGIHGGAIASYGDLKIKNTQIYGNNAVYGGGGVFAYDAGNVEITDSVIKLNQAHWGAGFSMVNGTLKMNGTTVHANQATSNVGGGLYLSGYYMLPTSYGTNFMIANSTISGNAATSGGGIYNQGNLSLVNSTVSGNQATENGGGLYHSTGGGFFGVLALRNATVTLNTAAKSGGGIYRYGDSGEINLGNTIVAANGNFNYSSPDVKGTVNSLGHNLFGSLNGAVVLGDSSGNLIKPDPKLSPLDNYGGKTRTHLPWLSSPAVNAGSNALAVNVDGNQLSTDQRGQGRFNGPVDIGAVVRYNERVF